MNYLVISEDKDGGNETVVATFAAARKLFAELVADEATLIASIEDEDGNELAGFEAP